MCGRFVVSTKNAFGLKYKASYNVTPSQLVPVKTKNSPKKPDVPGRPNPAKAKTINKKEYFGK